MSGFFSKQETVSEKRPNGKTLSCHSCGLYRHAQSPKMKPYGNFDKGIMVIGEALTEADDENGMPFMGKAGRLLKSALAVNDVVLYDDCVSLNAINCRPKGKNNSDRKGTQHEIDCCRRIVLDAIKQYKPKVIIALGFDAMNSLIGNRWQGSMENMVKWRGWKIPDQDLGCWVCPTLSPDEVMKYEHNKGVKTVWEQDIKNAIEMVNVPFPVYKEPEIIILKDDLSVLSKIVPPSIVAIDYETTGLKPHSEGHRIVCASVAVSPDKVYVFKMPRKAAKRKPFVELLRNKGIRKMAHNMKFEHTWSKEILNTTVQNWYWDSMIAAHILDNRSGITGLKFQTYVNFGIVDYNSNVSKSLIADGSNDYNSIESFIESSVKNEYEMLKYNGLDSIYEYRLAMLQQQIINNILPF